MVLIASSQLVKGAHGASHGAESLGEIPTFQVLSFLPQQVTVEGLMTVSPQRAVHRAHPLLDGGPRQKWEGVRARVGGWRQSPHLLTPSYSIWGNGLVGLGFRH